jgi:heme exporter protein B
MSGPCAVLEVQGLTLARGHRRLADNVSFALPSGRFIELRGPNGSGKTTLLRALARAPSAAREPIHWRVASRGFYFGHGSGFRPEIVVRTQLAVSLALYGAAANAARDQALLERFGLSRQANLTVRQLSQGQLRRLMLAVMCASGRKLWLIDEPLNALDGAAIALLQTILLEHFAQGGAVLVATHRTFEQALPALDPYCAGVLLLEAGRSRWQSTQETTAQSAQQSTPQSTDPFASPSFDATTDASPAGRSPTETSLQPQPVPLGENTRSNWQQLRWTLNRERVLALARPQDLAWPSVFHWMVVTLFPFALGSDPMLLERAAGGVFWISALLASLMGAARLFEADFEHGMLADCQHAGLSLAWLVFGKILAGCLLIGLPLGLASIPLGLLFGVRDSGLWILGGSLCLGTVSLIAGSCLFATLGLMARQAQLVICLLAIPIFVPLLIFGTAVLTGDAIAPVLTLASLALLALLSVPPIAARVLTLALE